MLIQRFLKRICNGKYFCLAAATALIVACLGLTVHGAPLYYQDFENLGRAGGSVTGVSMTSSGGNYHTPPTVTFSAPVGSGAAATAKMKVERSEINNGGSGYTNGTYNNVPYVGGGGTNAKAQVTVTGGQVTAVNCTDGGNDNYTSQPTGLNTAALGPGSGLVITTFLKVNAVNVTAGGSGYTTVPTVQFSGGQGGGAAGTANMVTTPFEDGPEWRKPPGYPWKQNANDPMVGRVVGDNQQGLFTAVAHSGTHSIYRHENFNQQSAYYDFGRDLVDNFYVKVWVYYEQEKERIVNVGVPVCTSGPWTNTLLGSGTITGADDGGQLINWPGAPPCAISKPSITDANTYFHNAVPGTGSNYLGTKIITIKSPTNVVRGTWQIEVLTNYWDPSVCSPAAPFPNQWNPTWNISKTLQVTPYSPTTLNPVAAGVQPGDTYEISGAAGPLYRAVHLWLENRGTQDPETGDWSNQQDWGKIAIWHRYVGGLCADGNNWKTFNRVDNNNFLSEAWTDISPFNLHNFANTTGWHSIEIRVYGSNADPNKNQKMLYFIDGNLVATKSRYAPGIGFNRIELGGLAVSQMYSFWDDVEIGFLPTSEGGPVVHDLGSISEVHSKSDGDWVTLPQAVIDIVHPPEVGIETTGWYHIQVPGQPGGVKCVNVENLESPSIGLKLGDLVAVSGQVGLNVDNGCGKVLYPMTPKLIMRGQSFSPIVVDLRGLKLATLPTLQGTRIKTWGKVVDSDLFTSFHLDDGSGAFGTTGIKVLADQSGASVLPDTFVTVVGLVECQNTGPGGTDEPVIRVIDVVNDIVQQASL